MNNSFTAQDRKTALVMFSNDPTNLNARQKAICLDSMAITLMTLKSIEGEGIVTRAIEQAQDRMISLLTGK